MGVLFGLIGGVGLTIVESMQGGDIVPRDCASLLLRLSPGEAFPQPVVTGGVLVCGISGAVRHAGSTLPIIQVGGVSARAGMAEVVSRTINAP